MPVIIKLTRRSGKEIFVNASQIYDFYRDDDYTVIEYNGDNVIFTKETPGEIMNKIGMASTIETTTTVYTPD